jgi:hypothetical protein
MHTALASLDLKQEILIQSKMLKIFYINAELFQ